MSRHTYRRVTCEYCNEIGKVERDVLERNQRFGNPFYACKNCGKVNYDDGIIEPALLSPEKLTKYAKTQGGPLRWIALWFGTLLTFFPVMLMAGSFFMALLALVPAAIVLIWILVMEKKTLDEKAYDKQVRNSMIRMLADENYATAILARIKPAPNSAWETRRYTFDVGEVSEQEVKALYFDVNDGCPEKPFRTWLLAPAFGIGMLIMLIVALASGKETLIKQPETLAVVDFRKTDAFGQAVTYETDNLIGPFAEYEISRGGYYLSADEDGLYYVVFLPKKYLKQYQSLIDGTASEKGEALPINGYSERLTDEVEQYAKEMIVEIINYYFEIDIMTVDMLSEDILNPLVLSAKEWEEPSWWALTEEGTLCLSICTIELLIGLVFYLLIKRQRKREESRS